VGAPSVNNLNPYNLLQKHFIVAGKVTTLRGDPVHGAKVVVEPGVSGEFRALQTSLQGEFSTEYYLNAELVKEFSVTLVVTKKGFSKAREVIDFAASDKTWVIPVTLRSSSENPDLLSQADLISSLAPRLKQLEASEGLSDKGEKDYARGVTEFLDRNRSDRALPFFTKAIRRDASCVGCRTMLGLAELDSGDWDGAYRNFAQAVQEGRQNPKAGRPEPALALGVMESWRHQPERATGLLSEALQYAPQDALALQEVGRSESLMQNWATAAAYLSKAIDAGARAEARLLRVEALLGAGDFPEANKEMTRYLNGRDVKSMPLRVREVWVQIENRKKVEAVYAKVRTEVDQPIDYLRRTTPELKGLEPATDQGQLDSILSTVGKNVWVFFRNFPNTSSLEEIHQEKLRRSGKAAETQDQKFHYLCATPAEPWGPGFSEYRAGLLGEQGQPHGLVDGYMLTAGFASASLILHPVYQSQATFRHLGSQKVNGRDTFVIAFAQRPERARLNGVFQSGDIALITFTQGLAWIDSDSYQIVRLRTDLLTPLHEVRLERQTTDIDFSEVHFNRISQGFWLPRNVTVTLDWNGKHLRNEHQYSDFKLFSVEAAQKIGNPSEVAQTSKETSGSDAPH
jgi:tetratricopeptide (TPR) repeat protein